MHAKGALWFGLPNHFRRWSGTRMWWPHSSLNANATPAHRQRVHVQGGAIQEEGKWSKGSKRMNYRMWWLKPSRTGRSFSLNKDYICNNTRKKGLYTWGSVCMKECECMQRENIFKLTKEAGVKVDKCHLN